MDFSKISPELRAKAEQCKTADELKKLAMEAGCELSEEELNAAGGGYTQCNLNKPANNHNDSSILEGKK